MQDKVVLITGGTSGIGKETALLLSKQGAKVIIASRSASNQHALAQQISASGASALFIQTDISDQASVQSMCETAHAKWGCIDCAVNNAGDEGCLQQLMDLQECDFDHVINTNLKGVWLSMKYEIAKMLPHGGAIVNISSNLTKTHIAKTGVYAASKAGVESLTKVAALEYGPLGIRVNAICPGATLTPMLQRICTAEALEDLAQTNPLRSIARAEEIAHTICWMLSPHASHVNGHILVVDGGSSIGKQ